ncbi:MAG: 50S ribosomal protein L11 methyltransferase [Leptospiraceae bacterium]|nr:50S ribosomal protein L11 methyltransferase [Leptospiraceae bacterium]
MTSSYIEIQLHLSQDVAQELSNLLDQNCLPDLSGYYEVLYQENRPSGDRTTLVLYFASDCADCRWDLEALLLAHGFDDYQIEENQIHQSDYQEAYKEHYRPFVVGDDFAVVPSWFKDTEDDARFGERKRIYLDPGLAFGTGLHATTRMMVRWLEKNPLDGLRTLDAGCGSGILSIAALRMGAREILAFDVDGNAVQATRANLDLNFPEGAPVQTLKGGWELPEIQTFDAELTLANITLNVFLSARDTVAALPGNRLVVSGIIEEQKQEFLEAFPMWKLHSEMQDDGWLVMEFRRGL